MKIRPWLQRPETLLPLRPRPRSIACFFRDSANVPRSILVLSSMIPLASPFARVSCAAPVQSPDVHSRIKWLQRSSPFVPSFSAGIAIGLLVHTLTCESATTPKFVPILLKKDSAPKGRIAKRDTSSTVARNIKSFANSGRSVRLTAPSNSRGAARRRTLLNRKLISFLRMLRLVASTTKW